MQRYEGKVTAGKGDYSYWLAKLEPVYFLRLGVHLFPGTLNVDIAVEYRLPKTGIIRITADETAPYGGTVNINIVKCQINGSPAYVLRTDANELGNGDHGRNIVEIASDEKLRDKFKLLDGSSVSLLLP
jgi:CTP-dependent riboflavin kinase